MSVHYPTTYRRYMHYRKKNDFVVIKYGAEWCGPCKKMSPIMDKLAKDHPHVYFLDVDVDNEEILKHEDLANVRSIPHFKFFVNNKLRREFKGSDSERLTRYVRRYSKPRLLPDNTEGDNNDSDNDPERVNKDDNDKEINDPDRVNNEEGIEIIETAEDLEQYILELEKDINSDSN